MKPEELTVEVVEGALGKLRERWKGQCFTVASMIVDRGLVEGRAVYGHFVGHIDPKSYFGSRSRHPFVQHGWVRLCDGRILDPTRWTFELNEPYIWLGENDGSYDEGGNRWRIATMSPWPDPEPGERRYQFQLGPEVIRDLEAHGAELVEEELDGLDYDLVSLELTTTQVCWLANFPLTCFSTTWHAADVYAQIVGYGLEAFIPIDNREAVLGGSK